MIYLFILMVSKDSLLMKENEIEIQQDHRLINKIKKKPPTRVKGITP